MTASISVGCYRLLFFGMKKIEMKKEKKKHADIFRTVSACLRRDVRHYMMDEWNIRWEEY